MNLKIVLSLSATSLMCFCVGLWLGFWQGVHHGAVIESVAFSALSTAQIKRLRSGDPDEVERVVSLLEFYVDHGIGQFLWYEEHGSKYFGQLLDDDYEESIVKGVRHAAHYRWQNPEENLSELFSGERKEEYLKAYLQRQKVVDEYGK